MIDTHYFRLFLIVHSYVLDFLVSLDLQRECEDLRLNLAALILISTCLYAFFALNLQSTLEFWHRLVD